ncbi:hypothetical protein Tco_0836840, partial [Tanacetum coccineum]
CLIKATKVREMEKFQEFLGSDESNLAEEKPRMNTSIGLSWMIQTSLWKNTSVFKKKRLKDMVEHLIGKTATYGKMDYCEDEDDSFTNLETEYPAIVLDDTSDATLSCEPTVSPLDQNEIDFEISFDKSDDEDYMNEFPAIAYNDLKSKSDPPIEPSVNMAPLAPREQRHPFLRYRGLEYSDQDIADFEERYVSAAYVHVFAVNEDKKDMAPLAPREQRHPFLRYRGLEYSDQDIADFEERLGRIHDRGTHRVHVLDFEGMPELMRDVLYARMRMEHRDGDGVAGLTGYEEDCLSPI